MSLVSTGCGRNRSFISLCLTLLFSFLLSVAEARIFTNGLSIINAPPNGSPAAAGSTMSISIEVSGDGAFGLDAANPNSNGPTHYTDLRIYLVSAEMDFNMTVAGPDFLTSQTGSVRQLSWRVPTCVPQGSYNLTFYETFAFENQAHFTITPVTVNISTNSQADIQPSCTLNTLLPQPQDSNPLAQSPLQGGASSATPTPTSSRMTTSFVTAAPTIELTLTLSSGFNFPTVTQTMFSETATVVIVSMETLTTTISEQQSVTTATLTQILTTTAVVGSDNSGFIPVNASIRSRSSPTLMTGTIVLSALALIFLSLVTSVYSFSL